MLGLKLNHVSKRGPRKPEHLISALYFIFQKHHPAIHRDLNTPSVSSHQDGTSSSQTSMATFIVEQKWKSSDLRSQRLTEAVVNLVTQTTSPLSLVDHPAFHELMEIAQPSYTLPSGRHLSRKLIPERAVRVLRAINSALDNVTDICLTIDLWSSRDMRSFVGITGHYTKDYQLQSVMLACQRFRGSHNAERIHEAYERTIATYGLDNRVSVIVTDNAANMIKAFSLPGMEKATADESDEELDDEDSTLTHPDITDELDYLPPDRHSCFAHTLQLVVRDGLKDAGQMKSVIAKASNFVSHVRKSTTATEILQDYRKLEIANQTRWNSQLKMLRSILRIPSEALDRVNFAGKLSSYELKVINELCEILQPFEEATDQVQGNKVVTSSLVIVCVRGLRDQLHELRQTYNCKLVSSLQASLEKRLGCYELMDCLRIATALDPRFKLDWCEVEEQDEVKALITQQMPKSLVPEQDCSNAPPAKRSKLMSFMKPRAMSSPVKTTSELDEYLREPSLPEDASPLSYWDANQHRFSALAKMAVKYLAIPASSAPVEHLFSVAGKMFRPDRCSLSDKRFEDMMLIRCNAHIRP